MLMFYCRRASPKHRYDIIEVEYGGGGHRTRLRDLKDLLLCLEVPPAPVYKGARGERWPRGGGAPKVGNPTPSRIPPSFLVQVGEGKEGREGEKERGAPPPLLIQFGLEGEGARGCPGRPFSSPTKAH